ncbi:hypothetical protein AB0M86_35900 [Streptomyces sp. NPDC051639]|uniref:hypothetical protein n=1 Tax=Streptomyces sp. NPDC051639 TaxID=3155671 RepID=UPI003440FD1D
MDDAVDLGEFVVRRASESESDALVGIDAVAVEGDVERQASIRRWCQRILGEPMSARPSCRSGQPF